MLFSWWSFDPGDLVERKAGTTVSVCLPARDEAATVGDIVGPIRRKLVDHLGLVDEIVVVDDSSTDGTAAAALAAGADVVPVDTLLPDEPPGAGKGNVIWRSLAACSGDIVCWIDADIRNFELHFVTGLLGPLLTDPAVSFVKGHYRRPLDGQPTGGGRVSELVARPLLSQFFPELATFAQPLSGEYAGRRALLESIPMVEGWGIDIGMLIDAWRAVGIEGMAQVDLGVREHRNRPLDELAEPALAILTTVLNRAGVPDVAPDPALLRFAGESGVDRVQVPFLERPPFRTLRGARRATSAAALPPPAPEALSQPVLPPPVSALPPHVASPSPSGFDRPRAIRAVSELLAAIGEDAARDGLLRTPERVADMLAELTSGLREDPGTHLDVRFEADHDELVLVRDIPFASMCEHHLMPFIGRAHVGYIPGVDGTVTGLSKLARLVEGYARRPQVQERLTGQVADAIETRLGPRGVVVIIEAEHLCMTMRGVRKPGAVTVTSAVRGIMRDDAAARAEAMSIIHGRR